MAKRLAVFGMAVALFLGMAGRCLAAGQVTLWFPPEWKTKADQAKQIADALGKGADVQVSPRLATSYPEIIQAFGNPGAEALYGGSFVTAILKARDLGVPLVQNVDGKEFYSGVMVYPKGENAEAILTGSPEQIAFAAAASSGESSAKAATGGKAAVATQNHGASCGAVKAGKAKAAFVKNFWWDSNKQNFPDFEMYKVPGISEEKNPDNVLTVSKDTPPDVAQKLAAAAKQAKEAFGSPNMADFDAAKLDFSLGLMQKGGIDPATYKW